MDHAVPQKIGKYEILGELGRGGFGAVYRARDPLTGRVVALKSIAPEFAADPEILNRYFREAHAAGSLHQRNIAAVDEVGDAEGRPYIAMEMVEGETLKNIIQLRTHLPLAAKLKLVQQICEGLGEAHRNGIIHRGLKPSNVLVTSSGEVKIVDFGVAHLESHILTRTGRFLATIDYLAPEQISDGQVDHRCDIWAVCAVTYELIAGRKPFAGSSIAATIAKIVTADPEPLSVCCPGVPADLDPIFAKGLAKVPAQRYSTFDDLLRDLEPVAARVQQNLIGELLIEAKALRSQGELDGARQKLRAALVLDPTHAEANRLLAEVQSEIEQREPKPSSSNATQVMFRAVTDEPEIALKEALRHADKLVEDGKYIEARTELQELQKEYRNSTQISLKLGILEPIVKAAMFVEDGRKAMAQGEYAEAVRALSAALEFNPRDTQALKLKASAIDERERLRQGRNAQTAGNQDSSRVDGLARVESLLAENKFEDAQDALLEMQQKDPNSAAIARKLQEIQLRIKLHALVSEGEQAFEQREFGEAARILAEAQQLVPTDERIRELRVRAVQERDRLRQVREAISGGQRAFRQGEREIAEKQFERALQLDATNPQAADLLAQVRVERRAHARVNELKSGLQEAGESIAANKLDEAQRRLEALKRDFPEAEQLAPLFEALKQKRAQSAPKPPLPAAAAPAQDPPPATEYSRSMELAEELRLSLQKLKTSRSSRPNPGMASTMASDPRPAKIQQQMPPAPPASGEGDVTWLLGAVPAKPVAPPSPPDHDATIASTPKLTSSGTEKKPSATDPKKPEPKPDQT